MEICGFGGFSGPWLTLRRDGYVSCSTYGGVGRYKYCRRFFKIAFQASSECFCVKTGALVRFLGPLGGLVRFSGTSEVLKIKIGKIAYRVQ